LKIGRPLFKINEDQPGPGTYRENKSPSKGAFISTSKLDRNPFKVPEDKSLSPAPG
jgi:hypothetical protein